MSRSDEPVLSPALADRDAVLRDLSRHLTVIDLWIEAEGQRG